MTHPQLKQGAVLNFQVLQNTATYQLRLANTAKGLWLCIEEAGVAWKLTITPEMVDQTITKASSGNQKMTIKDFTSALLTALGKTSQKWSIGIMTPIQLQVLRGGQPSKQASNHKIYLILSDKQKKLHYPFTFAMNELGQKDKLIEAIKTMKMQLEDLRAERGDKSQSSFSILNETLGTGEQLRIENEELKRRIRICQESLTQKRGAVQIDIILKEKNNLELQAQTKKREQTREIARCKNVYQLMERQIAQVRSEVQLITRQLSMLEDSVGNSNKLKSHAMKVLKSYQNQLRTQKKVLQKQVKQIQTLKRNILASKNNQRKVQGKIKQLQMEIDQSKKKANIKEISNRLHSFKGKGSSVDSPSSKSQSVASSTGKPHSQASSGNGRNNNLVRDNLIRKNAPASSSGRPNANLLKTSPNINLTSKPSGEKAPPRAVNSSHQNVQKNNYTNPRLFNTQKYRSGSKSQNQNNSVRSDSGQKKEVSRQDRDRQRRAMDRLTGPRNIGNPPVVPVPKAPSQDRLFKKPESNPPRAGSQTKPGMPNKGGSVKKDSAKEMLAKMKEIKAQYNNRSGSNAVASKPRGVQEKKYQ